MTTFSHAEPTNVATLARLTIPVVLTEADTLKIELTLTRDTIKGDKKDFTTAKMKVLAPTSDEQVARIKSMKADFTAGDATVHREPRLKTTPEIGLLLPYGDEVDITYDWAREDKEIEVKVEVKLELDDQHGGVRSFTETATAKLKVIGYKPKLTLEAQPTVAYADGADIVRIKPTLTLFDEVYTDPYRIDDADFDTKLFEATFDAAPPGTPFVLIPDVPADPKVLVLRCRFHLDDAVMKALAPNGDRPAKVSLRAYLPDDAEYPTPALGFQAEPIVVNLVPSHLELSVQPPALPTAGSTVHEQLSSRITVVVRSGNGNGVSGQMMKRDEALGTPPIVLDEAGGSVPMDSTNWLIRFAYDPRSEPALLQADEQWRRELDAYPQERTYGVASVDGGGNLIFNNIRTGRREPSFLYDHYELFKNSDGGGYGYIGGQGCTVHGDLRGNGETLAFRLPDGSESTHFEIKVGLLPRQKVTVRVVVKAHSDEKLEKASVTVDGVAGGPWETDANGQVDIPDLREGDNYVAAATWQTDPWPGSGIEGHEVKGRQPFRVALVAVEASTPPEPQRVEVTLPCSTKWALTTRVSFSWSFIKLLVPLANPALAKVLKIAPIGISLIGAQLEETTSHKVRWIGFVGIGAVFSGKWSDIVDAAKGSFELLKSLPVLKQLWGALQAGGFVAQAGKTIGQGGMVYKLEDAWNALASRMKEVSPGASVPSATDFTTPKPVAWEDFFSYGWVDGLELSVVASVSFGYAHFRNVETYCVEYSLTHPGIQIGSYNVGSPGLSAQIVYGEWRFIN